MNRWKASSAAVFVLTFVLYGLAMLPERARHPREGSTHLADVAAAERADA